MGTSSSLGEFAGKVDRIAVDLDSGSKAAMRTVGMGAKADAVEALRAELGDGSMSGWPRRGKTAELPVRYTVGSSGDAVIISPQGSASAGGWSILQSGRNQGSASGVHGPGQFAADGSTVRTKSGRVKASKRRKARRWNGTTQPKHTWGEASALMVKRTPGRVRDEMLHRALKRHLG